MPWLRMELGRPSLQVLVNQAVSSSTAANCTQHEGALSPESFNGPCSLCISPRCWPPHVFCQPPVGHPL